LLSHVRLFLTPWIAARQASLSITNSRSSLRLMSIESVMPSSHVILCRPLLQIANIRWIMEKEKIKGYLRGKSSDLVADLTWEIGKMWVQNNYWSVWYCGHGWWRFWEEKLCGTARLLEYKKFEEPKSFEWECSLCLGLSKEVCSRNRGSRLSNR